MNRLCFKNRWLLALAILLLAACGGGDVAQPIETESDAPAEETAAETATEAEAPAEEVSEEPAVLRIGRTGYPESLNPGAAVSVLGQSIFNLTYDSLYQLELDGTYSLELAESVDVSDDGVVYTFKIRDGVTFHDGEPLTAEDVAFSLNFYAANEDFPILNVYTSFFESVEATDESTVVVTMTEAIPNPETQFYLLYVLPEHIWGDLEGAAAVEFENSEMIGSGPFSLVESSQDEFVRLAAVEDHFLNSPQIDELIFQTFENQDALVQALRTGQVDLITEVPSTAVGSLRDEDNIEVVTGPPLEPSVTDIAINQVTAENCPEGSVCSNHPALQDREVRLAMSHATDKQQIIDVVLLGEANPGITLIPDGLGVFYNDALTDYAFDPDMANQILDDAGYLDTDGDGVREMPDGGQPLNFRLNWPTDFDDAPRIAELVGDMWAEIGIATEPQGLDPDALLGICCPTLDYDVMIWGWVSDPDPGFFLSLMITDEIASGNNETGFSNATYDELYLQQAVELDPDTRQEMVREMQQIMFDEIPYIIPYYDVSIQAYRSDAFTGWQTDAGKILLEGPSSVLVVEPVR